MINIIKQFFKKKELPIKEEPMKYIYIVGDNIYMSDKEDGSYPELIGNLYKLTDLYELIHKKIEINAILYIYHRINVRVGFFANKKDALDKLIQAEGIKKYKHIILDRRNHL